MAIDPNSSASALAPAANPADTPAPPEMRAAAPEEKQGFIRRNSLQLSGVSNLIADGLMMFKGVKEKNKLIISGGALYTLGGLNLAFFGKAKTKDKENQLTIDTAEFLQEKAGHSLQGTALAGTNTDESFSKNAARNTLYAYTAGALAFLGAGIKSFFSKENVGKKFLDKEGSGLLIYGISSTFFKVLSLLVPEKTIKEKQEEGTDKKSGVINAAIQWIREKPLRIFGYGSLVTDAALGFNTYQEYKNPEKKKAGKNYQIIGGATILYLLADFLIAQSNKNPANAEGKLEASAQQRVEDLAADAIAREPQEKQTALIREVSEFLAARPEINAKADGIAQSIQQRVERKTQGAWVSRTQDTQALQPAR